MLSRNILLPEVPPRARQAWSGGAVSAGWNPAIDSAGVKRWTSRATCRASDESDATGLVDSRGSASSARVEGKAAAHLRRWTEGAEVDRLGAVELGTCHQVQGTSLTGPPPLARGLHPSTDPGTPLLTVGKVANS